MTLPVQACTNCGDCISLLLRLKALDTMSVIPIETDRQFIISI